jgi:hypothetical protein
MHEIRSRADFGESRVASALDGTAGALSPGPHIGGPARPPPEPSPHRHATSDDGRRGAPEYAPLDGEWLARRWPGVHVRVAELLSGEGTGGAGPLLRAVVQLGTLTPADVRVFARSAPQAAEPALADELRLASVRSHHNGAVVFEATAAPTVPDTATDLILTVSPAPRLLEGGPLRSVEALVHAS